LPVAAEVDAVSRDLAILADAWVISPVRGFI